MEDRCHVPTLAAISLRCHVLLDLASHLLVQVLTVLFQNLTAYEREKLLFLSVALDSRVQLLNFLVSLGQLVMVSVVLLQLAAVELFFGLS